MERDRDTEEEDNTPSPAGDAREKLKLAAHYAMLGFAPVVSVVALVVAVLVPDKHPDQARQSEVNSRVDSLNASLMASRSELDNYKVAMAHERSAREEERKKQDERDKKIIQNVTRLQVKMKISPTLEDQLREAVSARAVTSAVASAPVAASPAIIAISAPVVTSPAAVAISAPVAASAPPKAEKADKKHAQVKALKEAIEKFNKE
jgi:hypothetical protein